MARAVTVFNVVVGVATIGAFLLAADCQIWRTVCRPAESGSAGLALREERADRPTMDEPAPDETVRDPMRLCLADQLLAHEAGGYSPSYAVCSEWVGGSAFRSNLSVGFGQSDDFGRLASFVCLNPDQIDIAVAPGIPAASVLCNFPWNLRGRDPERLVSHIVARFFHGGDFAAETTLLADGEYLHVRVLEYFHDEKRAVLTYATDSSELWSQNGVGRLRVQEMRGDDSRGRISLRFTSSGRLAEMRLVQ